jgi:hypothetical protein
MKLPVTKSLEALGVTTWLVAGSLLAVLLLAAAFPPGISGMGQWHLMSSALTTLGVALLSGLIVDALRFLARRLGARQVRTLPSLASVFSNELGWPVPGRRPTL